MPLFLRTAIAAPRHLLRLIVALAMLASSSCVQGSSDTVSGPDSSLAQVTLNHATAMVELTNAERVRAGLQKLSSDARLMQAAQIQAEQMMRSGLLQHVLANASYPSTQDRLAVVGYGWQTWAENLAYGHATSWEAISGWMGSPDHRSNILNGLYTDIGARVCA